MLTRRGLGAKAQGRRGLVSNAGALLANRMVQAVLGWSGTVMIAQTLSTEQFGQFTLIFTVLGLMSIVTDLGIGRLAVRGMLADDDPERFAGSYLGLRSMLGVLGYLVAVLVLVVGGYPSELVGATAVAGVVVLLATPSAALDVVFQSRQRLGVTGPMTSMGMFGQLALTAALAAAGGSVLLFTLPAVLCQVLILAWKIPAARRLVPLRPRVDLRLWRSLLREALPLTIGFGLITLYTRVDTVMLSQLGDFEDVGIYGVSYKFIDVMHFASSAVTGPLLPLLVAAWPGEMHAFRDAARRGAMLLGLAGGLAATGLLAFAGPLTGFLYGQDYVPGANTTRILALSELLAFATALAMCCLVSAARHRRYPLVALLGLVTNVGLNLVLIPALSYQGAALATLISNLVVFGLMWALLLGIPGIRPLGLGRLVVVPVAIGVGVAVGLAADTVLPWAIAALLSSLAYAATATALGLPLAGGFVVPSIPRSVPWRKS